MWGTWCLTLEHVVIAALAVKTASLGNHIPSYQRWYDLSNQLIWLWMYHQQPPNIKKIMEITVLMIP